MQSALETQNPFACSSDLPGLKPTHGHADVNPNFTRHLGLVDVVARSQEGWDEKNPAAEGARDAISSTFEGYGGMPAGVR